MKGTEQTWRRFELSKFTFEMVPTDYMVFKLDNPVRESETIKYAKLATGDLKPDVGDHCAVAGWGRYKYPDVPIEEMTKNDFPARLKSGQATIVSGDNCFNLNSTICTLPRLVSGKYQGLTCFGDGGGPLECEKNGVKYVAGFIDAGENPCNNFTLSTIHLSISNQIDWIRQNM